MHCADIDTPTTPPRVRVVPRSCMVEAFILKEEARARRIAEARESLKHALRRSKALSHAHSMFEVLGIFPAL
jgi:hypothetical protein